MRGPPWIRELRPSWYAQGFPQYAVNFVRRFVTGSYASISASVAPPANASEPLARDEFGFRKVIVAATPYGKLYGIDSANGEVLWSRIFGLGWAAKVGGQVIPAKMFVTRTVTDGESPQVVVVTQRKASNVRHSLLPFGWSAYAERRVSSTRFSSTSTP